MKIHLISYGDAKYEIQREFFRETAVSSAFFNEISIFSKEDMRPEFIAEFKVILDHSRGGGFIWKPYFIKHTLDKLDDNDILVYCDAGCMINSWGAERFNQYVKLLMNSETGVIAFELNNKEYEYTKKEVFEYLKPSKAVVNSKQLLATIILIKKCSHSVMLVDKWYDVLNHRAELFSDELDPAIQEPGFITHRHDQSIWSVILKTYGADILPDETYFDDFMRDGQLFPFWAARLGRFDPFYIAVSGEEPLYEIKVVTSP
jgi:hypothetical protein